MSLSSASDSSPVHPDLPDASIGLALSGGGYRASAFHLGTLAYLNRVKLLPNLKMLSTVSGGTFTGAKYILSLVEGEGFSGFFQGFYEFLRVQNLSDAGLKDLSHGEIQVPSGERKLISSMANVYADTFLKTPNGGAYTLGDIIKSNISVKEIVFNTVEFLTGEAFKFQKTDNPEYYVGNEHISISKEEAQHIRIADIVAASSCFPGGFEPLAFPHDFAWPNDQIFRSIQETINKQIPESVKEDMLDLEQEKVIDEAAKNQSIGELEGERHDKYLALMDGGIYDNQGIDSLLLADQQNNTEELGIFIISDVDRAQDTLYLHPINNPPSTDLTLEQVDWLIRIFLVACVLTVGSTGYEIWREIQTKTFIFGQHFFSALMPLLLSILVLVTLWRGRSIIRNNVLPRIPLVGRKAWHDLKNLTVDEFLYLIELRFTSLMALTRAVFMDRIKTLTFEKINIEQDSKYILNQIDRLILDKTTLPGVMPLGDGQGNLNGMVRSAANMETTLWFDNPTQLPTLVASGQATICFYLMDHIIKRYGTDQSTYPASVKPMWDTLTQDWERFNNEPFWLLIQDLEFETAEKWLLDQGLGFETVEELLNSLDPSA